MMSINSWLKLTGIGCMLLGTALAVSFPAFAQENRFITAEQILDLRLASDVHLSPDGKTIAFVITEPSGPGQPEKANKTNIWLVPVDASAPERMLEGSSDKDTSPRWSPDGTTLAFLSGREEAGASGSQNNQIYLWSVQRGKAERLTLIDEGVQQFKWAPDGKIIAFTTR